MATVELWIQLENRVWDACPNNIDRMHGETIAHMEGVNPVDVTRTSPESGVTNTRTMYYPTNSGTVEEAGGTTWKPLQALMYRRYEANWAAPADVKINAWDLNERDPRDAGTMGTIPGPTIECNVGDNVVVHFRNKDGRAVLAVEARTHSMHPHGIVFDPRFDGAFPLSTPDPDQPVDVAEEALWAAGGVSGFKQGDRVPPGGTFTYTWETFGWPTTAGVWHYHDHSICDAENVMLGALGFLVIHNPEDPDDVDDPDLPSDDPNGKPVREFILEIPDFLRVTKESLTGLALIDRESSAPAAKVAMPEVLELARAARRDSKSGEAARRFEELSREVLVTKDLGWLKASINLIDFTIKELLLPRYRTPPSKAQYLQYYHELPGVGMCINGRRFLGNTPTMVAGPDTKMRFGLAAMNRLEFHTFHIHGHRWVVPGPAGTDSAAIQSSPQVQAASQFEDTRIFGPANSFGFTINQGSFMGSRFTPDPTLAPGIGEWHMHCHVLNHMMPGGMMGSLLVVEGGELALALPMGTPCPKEEIDVPANTVVVDAFAFTTKDLTAPAGTTIPWQFDEANHTVETLTTPAGAADIDINNGGGKFDAVPVGESHSRVVTGSPGQSYTYQCGIHGASMPGTITII